MGRQPLLRVLHTWLIDECGLWTLVYGILHQARWLHATYFKVNCQLNQSDYSLLRFYLSDWFLLDIQCTALKWEVGLGHEETIPRSFISLFHCRRHRSRHNMKKQLDQNPAVKLHFGSKNTLVRSPSGTCWQYLHIILRSTHFWELCVNTVPDGSSPIPQQQDIDMHRCQSPRDCELHWTGQSYTHRFTTHHSTCLPAFLSELLSLR